MKTVKSFYLNVALASVLLCMCAAVAMAESHLGDQVSAGEKLTVEEKQALEPMLAHYYALDGSKPALQSVVSDAINCGCRGSCIADLVDLMNRAIKAGLTNEEASQEVRSALKAVDNRCKERGIDATPEEISRAVKAHFESRLRERKVVF